MAPQKGRIFIDTAAFFGLPNGRSTHQGLQVIEPLITLVQTGQRGARQGITGAAAV